MLANALLSPVAVLVPHAKRTVVDEAVAGAKAVVIVGCGFFTEHLFLVSTDPELNVVEESGAQLTDADVVDVVFVTHKRLLSSQRKRYPLSS
jgi:alkylhydroperoxidase family enzyme